MSLRYSADFGRSGLVFAFLSVVLFQKISKFGLTQLQPFFLVGAFSLKEKSPTITVGSFFQLTISLWMVHFSYNSYNFIQFLLSLRSSIFTSSKKLKGAKGYSLRVFSALRLFFRKKIHRRVPFNFLIFSDRMDVEKSQRVPLFSFFGIVRLFYFFSIKGPQFTNTLTFWSPFAIFEPEIWRRLEPFPACW